MALIASLLWDNLSPMAVMAATGKTTPQLLSPQNQLISQSAEKEFTLAPLPYAYDALDNYIDTQTMTIHHDRHHAGYVRRLNAAIAKHPEFQGYPLEALLKNLDQLPEDIRSAVRKNGGGHANHSMFWEIMAPNAAGQPTGEIAQIIDAKFGSFDDFKQAFNAAGAGRFGSGWAWLVLTPEGNVEVTSTANQDSPFMDGNYPIMGNDVWEHAYYLKYQNRRGDYLNAWWNVVNRDRTRTLTQDRFCLAQDGH
ncbi:MAG: superoxide dismutase [Cyanobacteria bacterium J06642_11]